MVAQFPYRWGYDDIIYRISRGILKLAKVVGTRLNQKAISGSMGKVVKVVGARGNLKAISGVMGTDVRIFFSDVYAIWMEFIKLPWKFYIMAGELGVSWSKFRMGQHPPGRKHM